MFATTKLSSTSVYRRITMVFLRLFGPLLFGRASSSANIVGFDCRVGVVPWVKTAEAKTRGGPEGQNGRGSKILDT